MTQSAVHQLVWEIHRRGRGEEYRTDPGAYLATACERLGVADDARSALEQLDFSQLIDIGVHPMSVLFFAHANHVPMPQYLGAIGADPAHVETFRQIFENANRSRPGVARAPTERE
ncbi:MAG: hypothetical protein ACKVKO_11030 [Acidimicrobiales bacterium]